MSDTSYLDTGYLDTNSARRIMEQPKVCAECGLEMSAGQIADECEMCGAPRCRDCAAGAGDSLDGHYICSACAAD